MHGRILCLRARYDTVRPHAMTRELRDSAETMKSTEVLGRAATASEPFDESSFRASTAGGEARQRRTAIRTGSCVTRRANRTRPATGHRRTRGASRAPPAPAPPTCAATPRGHARGKLAILSCTIRRAVGTRRTCPRAAQGPAGRGYTIHVDTVRAGRRGVRSFPVRCGML